MASIDTITNAVHTKALHTYIFTLVYLAAGGPFALRICTCIVDYTNLQLASTILFLFFENVLVTWRWRYDIIAFRNLVIGVLAY